MTPFSVIIPARNAARTLGICLQAVASSGLTPAEVLVVDDGSTDSTAAVAQQYRSRILKTHCGRGPMQPRFEGARVACSPVLIFIDADVCVEPDTFERILKHFENPEVSAITGILSQKPGVDCFFSIFKNEYMHFIFKRQPRRSTFLYGSLWAIRKKDLLFFDPISEPFGSLVSDSEMGLRLTGGGKTVLLDHALEVRHLKEYSLAGLLKNDFVIPFMFSQMFCRYGQPEALLDGKGFSHARTGQVVGTAMAFLSLVCLLSALVVPCCKATLLFVAAAGSVAVLLYWRSFISALLKTRGPLFTFSAMLFLLLDQAVMFTGMVSGFIYAAAGKWIFRKAPGQHHQSLSPAACHRSPKSSQPPASPGKTDIILLSYQQAPFLQEALDSLLRQTYQDFKIIAVDDGSTDGSFEILKDYESRYPDRLRVWTHEGHRNLGMPASYRLGLSKTSAEFIAFLEADDVWGPRNLEEKIAALKSNPEAGTVYSSYRAFGGGTAELYWKLHCAVNSAGVPRQQPFDNFRTLLERNNVSSFTHFITRRHCLAGIPLPAEHGDRLDWWVLAHLSRRALFVYLPEKLCRWRIHPGSVSYRRWDTAELKRFNRFLLALYASLSEIPKPSAASADEASKRQALESALRSQQLIRQTGNWFHPRRLCRHPLQALRFLLHCLLKNSLLR